VIEDVSVVITYAFDGIKPHSTEVDLHSLRTASAKIHEGHRFILAAFLKENYYWEGKLLDSALYSLPAQDWNKHNI
jgi:ribosomal-protein-alanine N-acetyltransferase